MSTLNDVMREREAHTFIWWSSRPPSGTNVKELWRRFEDCVGSTLAAYPQYSLYHASVTQAEVLHQDNQGMYFPLVATVIVYCPSGYTGSREEVRRILEGCVTGLLPGVTWEYQTAYVPSPVPLPTPIADYLKWVAVIAGVAVGWWALGIKAAIAGGLALTLLLKPPGTEKVLPERPEYAVLAMGGIAALYFLSRRPTVVVIKEGE